MDTSQVTTPRNPNLVRIGTAGLPPGLAREAYFDRLDFVELDVTLAEPPRDAILRRWRASAPPEAGFAVVAWHRVTHDTEAAAALGLHDDLPTAARPLVGWFRSTPEVEAAWMRTLAAARTLAAEVVLFQTPASFTPAHENRDALRRFFTQARSAAPDLVLAWEPRGLWEIPVAFSLAEEAGVVLAVDPLADEDEPLPEGPIAYFRVRGLGRRVDDADLESLADICAGYERAFVVFGSPSRLSDASRFRRLLATSG